MERTSASLLERLRGPADAEAWPRFVELYTPLLFEWARGVGLQDADAADLVQDVLTHLLRTLPEFRYDPGKSFRAWLHTVTLNQWRASLRKRAARLPIDASADPDAVPVEDEAFWEAEYQRHLTARALALIQAEFQPSTWKAFWECVVADRNAVEVGRELGLRPGAVRAAKFRVLCRLRRELDGLLD
jgi:RNA polymerase sigma-70 factor (ECF subfamily)